MRCKLVILFLVSLLLFKTSPGQTQQLPKEGGYDTPLGDVTLHYVVRGYGPIVFVVSPGWGSGSRYLQHGLSPLEESFTMVYIDMRGAGGSTRPKDVMRMSHSVMAGDIENLRRYLKLDKVMLFGHSDGGTLSLEYAERYPEHTKKVVLADPQILGDIGIQETENFLTLWQNDPHYAQAAKQARKDFTPHDSDDAFEHDLSIELPMYVSDPDRYVPVLTKDFSDTHLSSFAERQQRMADELEKRDQTKDFRKITAKTLILSGTADWVCPYQTAVRASSAIPNARVSLYVNKGHVLWIEDPARFFAEVKAFFLEL